MSTTRHIALLVALTFACLASGSAALGNPLDLVKAQRAFNKWMKEDPVAHSDYQDVKKGSAYKDGMETTAITAATLGGGAAVGLLPILVSPLGSAIGAAATGAAAVAAVAAGSVAVGAVIHTKLDARKAVVNRMIKDRKSPSRVPYAVLKYYRPDLAKRIPPDGKFQTADRVLKADYYQPKAAPNLAPARAMNAPTAAPQRGLMHSLLSKVRGR